MRGETSLRELRASTYKQRPFWPQVFRLTHVCWPFRKCNFGEAVEGYFLMRGAIKVQARNQDCFRTAPRWELSKLERRGLIFESCIENFNPEWKLAFLWNTVSFTGAVLSRETWFFSSLTQAASDEFQHFSQRQIKNPNGLKKADLPRVYMCESRSSVENNRMIPQRTHPGRYILPLWKSSPRDSWLQPRIETCPSFHDQSVIHSEKRFCLPVCLRPKAAKTHTSTCLTHRFPVHVGCSSVQRVLNGRWVNMCATAAALR